MIPLWLHTALWKNFFSIFAMEEAASLIELSGGIDDAEEDISAEAWVFDLFDDMDIISFLYSDVYLDSEHPYHC